MSECARFQHQKVYGRVRVGITNSMALFYSSIFFSVFYLDYKYLPKSFEENISAFVMRFFRP